MTRDEIREAAEKDLWTFACLVNPHMLYGDVHKKVFRQLMVDKDQLILMPRAHLKSHMVAVYVVWRLCKSPWWTFKYATATEKLAKDQMYAIKNMLESEVVARYWPNMVEPDEGKREQWSATAIKLDHPERKSRMVRDSSVEIVTVGSSSTGQHCDEMIFDDLVVPTNAYTEEGRNKVAAAFSQFSSVLNPGQISKGVGTRYHPRDLYYLIQEMKMEVFNDTGEVVGSSTVFEIIDYTVKDDDNQYLWPRTKCPKTGRWEGFDDKTLSKIKAKYYAMGEKLQFFAQYYNNPNDPESSRFNYDRFDYYEQRLLTQDHDGGGWYYSGRALSVFAAVDFAYTKNAGSDYTAIAVIGVDTDGYIYILDIAQFKTDKQETYFRRLEEMHRKWGFRRCRLETNSGGNVIAEDLKDRFRKSGYVCAFDQKAQTMKGGSKEERIQAIVEPRYENGTIKHFKGGLIPTLEEQLILANPPHDDLKDALASAIEISKVPGNKGARLQRFGSNVVSARFGGSR